jgi:hypothetical protein
LEGGGGRGETEQLVSVGGWRDNTSLEWTRLSAVLVRVSVGEVGRASGGGRPGRRAPQLEAVIPPPRQRWWELYRFDRVSVAERGQVGRVGSRRCPRLGRERRR